MCTNYDILDYSIAQVEEGCERSLNMPVAQQPPGSDKLLTAILLLSMLKMLTSNPFFMYWMRRNTAYFIFFYVCKSPSNRWENRRRMDQNVKSA